MKNENRDYDCNEELKIDYTDKACEKYHQEVDNICQSTTPH